MRYDATLKKLFRQPPDKLLSHVLGRPIAVTHTLPTDLITVENLHPDLLFETSASDLLHMELHGYAMPEFAKRNLIYFALVLRDYDRPPLQIVFWVGKQRIGVTNGLYYPPQLAYSYTVIDVRDIDARVLLDGGGVGESIFAILCKFDDERKIVAEILRRIAALPAVQQREAIAQLLVLSGLRDLQPVVKQEVAHMPLSFDIHENAYLQEVFMEGKEEGKEEGERQGRLKAVRELLMEMLAKKFGPLPASFEDRIAKAELTSLEKWCLCLYDSSSLEEVFSHS